MFIRTMLIDDHEVVRRGLAELLSAEADIEIVASLGSVGEALEADLSSVDVAVVDVRLPDGDGIDLVRRLRSQLPNLHCLVLTAYEDDDALLDAHAARLLNDPRARAAVLEFFSEVLDLRRLDDLTRVLTKVSLAVRASAA